MLIIWNKPELKDDKNAHKELRIYPHRRLKSRCQPKVFFVSGKASNDNHFWAYNNKLQKNSFQNFFSSFLHKMTMQVIRIAFLTSHLYVVRYCFWAAPCIISVLKRPRNDFVYAKDISLCWCSFELV